MIEYLLTTVNNLLTTINIGSIISYSYIVNVLYYNDVVKHYKYIIHNLTASNMLFIKFMQWFSSNNMSDEIKDLIRGFADNVPYTSSDIEYAQLEELIQVAESNNQTLILNTTPINSGTIAIVYEGTLDDKPVILKQLRKNINIELKKSIELMKFIGEITKYIPYLYLFRLSEIISINEPSLLEQVNFKKEIVNGKKFYETFKDNKDIIIPHFYTTITEMHPNFILMEKIIGRKAQELSDAELPNYCKTYNKLLLESLINKGVVHADLHIGNIFFMKDNKIAIIDFGHVLFIDKELSRKISHFYKFLFNRQVKKLAKFCIDQSVYAPENRICSKSMKKNTSIMIESLAGLFGEDKLLSGKKPINIYNILDINAVLQKINARMNDEFMNVILAIGPMSSVVSILKRNDQDNGLKDVFFNYVQDKVPDKLKNYNE